MDKPMNLPHLLPHLLTLCNWAQAAQEQPLTHKVNHLGSGLTPDVASGAKGRKFESYRAHHKINNLEDPEEFLQGFTPPFS